MLTKKKLDCGGDQKLICTDIKRTTHTKLKQGTSNNLEAYKKELKRDYSKKNRLKKLDYYFEEKIFNGIEKFDKVADNMNCRKRNFFKIIFRKYFLCLIFFCCFVGLGIIIPTLNNINSGITNDENNKKYSILAYIASKLGTECIWLYHVLFFTLNLVIILVIIYTIKKIIKYDVIKAGKSKMKSKEYIRFMKVGYRNK
ncbi:hypothetical protein PVMG_06070 [Plasmodium vivax Mauritania I]|uniref:Variable surface protein Vir35 n=1 Tax=Plasmodium vivax Mauritania I TaxID=1035515 RepID=A0A0J9VQI8_PLAVI|nr:hypothetical protein PVMG_06070 [Plasmodium vivax Mauritania I]